MTEDRANPRAAMGLGEGAESLAGWGIPADCDSVQRGLKNGLGMDCLGHFRASVSATERAESVGLRLGICGTELSW